MIQLSICIPSYNRAKFLPDLLQSIVSQYTEQVEVVICDNGSIDETKEVVLSWQRKYPRIFYKKLQENIGPDRCFLHSVELASGLFCWLMGDDAIIETGGIARVLRALSSDITGITVHRAAYDVLLQKRWIEQSSMTQDYNFTKAKDCFTQLFSLFGFLSAQIVHKEKWQAVVIEEDVSPYFNAYILIYIIGRMIQKDPNWHYIHTPCVGWRSGNDSFAKELGRYGRFILDVTGYTSIAKGLFSTQKDLYRIALN